MAHLAAIKIVEATALSAQGQLLRVVESAPTLKLLDSPFGARCADCDHANHTNDNGVRGACATFGCSCKSHKALTETRREKLVIHPRLIESFDPSTRIADVIIMEDGLGNSRDNHYYSPNTIRQAAIEGVFNSAQAYADHPGLDEDINRPERSVRDLIGWYFNTTCVESNGKTILKAKMKIQEGQDWVIGIIKEAIAYGKRFPNKTYVGISINADGDVAPIQQNGKQVNDVRRITEAFSADMVTKPARGGKFLSLVESASGARNINRKVDMDLKTLIEEAARLKESGARGEIDKAKFEAVMTSIASLKESDTKGMNTPGLNNLSEAEKSFMESMSPEDRLHAGSLGESELPAFIKKKMGESSKSNDTKIPGATPIEIGTPTGNSLETNARTGGMANAGGSGGGMSESRVREDDMMEAGGKGRGALIESDPAKLYPGLYQSALREAQASVGTELSKLQAEVAQLRAERNLRESIDLAKSMVGKAGLPPAVGKRLLENAIGKSQSEIARLIENEVAFVKEMGIDTTRRVEGAGERIALRESEGNSNASTFLAGVGG